MFRSNMAAMRLAFEKYADAAGFLAKVEGAAARAEGAVAKSGVRLRSSPTIRGTLAGAEHAAPAHMGALQHTMNTRVPVRAPATPVSAPAAAAPPPRTFAPHTGNMGPAERVSNFAEKVRTLPTPTPELRRWQGVHVSSSPTEVDARHLHDIWSGLSPKVQQQTNRSVFVQHGGMSPKAALTLQGHNPSMDAQTGSVAQDFLHRAELARHPNREIRMASLENMRNHSNNIDMLAAQKSTASHVKAATVYWLYKRAERLQGGKADGMSDECFDKKQLGIGTKVEREHTKDKNVAREIARDHLEEIPDYYSRLARMEDSAKTAAANYLLDQIAKPKLRNLSAFPPNKALKVKVAFTESEYSGGTSIGGGTRVNAGYIPPFKDPPIKTAGPPSELRGKAAAMRDELEKLNGLATTPAGRLSQARAVGLPNTTPKKPSVAQLTKPIGYGRPAVGATAA